MEQHHQNRLKVCLNCLYKASRPVNPDEIKLFKDKAISNYDPTNEFMPLGICNNCRIRLHANNDGRGNAPILSTLGNYEAICTTGKIAWAYSMGYP